MWKPVSYGWWRSYAQRRQILPKLWCSVNLLQAAPSCMLFRLPATRGWLLPRRYRATECYVTEEEKSVLVKFFMDEGKGVCRVLFCTIAFGMGINIPNISRIIHDGPSEITDAYVQESGRGGHNGEQCEVVLYTFSGSTKGYVSWDMKNYCQNEKTYRRVILLSHFSGGINQPRPAHLCCDLCTKRCLCDCACNQCFCPNQNVPCSSCCVCGLKCSYVHSFDVVMPMHLMQVHDSQSSSSESSIWHSCIITVYYFLFVYDMQS